MINPKVIFTLGIVVFGLICIVFYESYALYKTSTTHNFVDGVVGEFNTHGDLKIAVYIDGEKSNEFPASTNGYMYDKCECSNGGIPSWNAATWSLTVKDVKNPTVCNVYFVEGSNLGHAIIASNELKETTPTLFNDISNSSTTGLYSYEEVDGTSYFFRGDKATLTNNVIFGEFQWKIIRIDYEGNIKLIYNGVCPGNKCTINNIGTVTQIGTSTFGSNNNLAHYVGYTFGVYDNSSKIKTMVENWYNSNLTSYDSYIADVVYCNDRRIVRTSGSEIYYGANDRINDTKTPSLDCINIEDSYTKEKVINKGNGMLTKKIGLITADEILMAGGKPGTVNSTYYLYSNQTYWSISPAYFKSGTAISYAVYYNGENSTVPVYDAGLCSSGACGVRPVIAINSNVQIIGGDGSITTPYIVNTN